MPDAALHVSDLPAGVALVPGAVELLGCSPELHDEVTREVLGLRLASLLPPKPDQGGFILAHNDPGVRAADEAASSFTVFCQGLGLTLSSSNLWRRLSRLLASVRVSLNVRFGHREKALC